MNVKKRLQQEFDSGYEAGALSIAQQFKMSYDANPDVTVDEFMATVDDIILHLLPADKPVIVTLDAVAVQPSLCKHGRAMDEYCLPCGRVNGNDQ